MATIEKKIDNMISQMGTGGPRSEWKSILEDILDSIRLSRRVVHQVWNAPDAAAANNAMTQHDLNTLAQANCPVNCVGEASPDFPVNVKVTGTQLTGATSVTCTVTGVDQYGEAQTESHTVTTAAKTSTGSIAFATISAIVITAITGTGNAGDLLDVGYQTKYGLIGRIAAAADLFKITEDGVESGIGDVTLDLTNHTIIFETAPNATHIYEAWYRSTE